MMPSVALIGIPGARRLPPVPVPLFLLWPFALGCVGVSALLRRDRPLQAAKLRAALQVFGELRGLTIDVDSARGEQVRIRFL